MASGVSSTACAGQFPIGVPGQPWGDAERAEWLSTRERKRSYQTEVVAKLKALEHGSFDVQQYGALSQDPQRYPLFAAKSRDWQADKPCVLVTGGVHGCARAIIR